MMCAWQMRGQCRDGSGGWLCGLGCYWTRMLLGWNEACPQAYRCETGALEGCGMGVQSGAVHSHVAYLPRAMAVEPPPAPRLLSHLPPHTHCLSLTVLSLFPPTPPHKQVTCASFHKASGLLVVGTSSGLFDMYQLPGFENLQKLSISRERVSSVAFNTTGGCLAGLLNGWCCYLVGGGSAARALCVLVCCVFGVFRVVGTGCCCRCCQACCKVQR